MQNDQRFVVGRAKNTLARDGQAVRSRDRNLERPRDFKVGCAEHNDFCWLLNVSVDLISDRIVHSPTRTTRKRNRRDHLHRINLNNRYSAVHPRRIADIEHEQTTPSRVVRQSIWAVTDFDSTEQRLVRAAVNARPSTTTIRRKEKILLAVDQDTGNAGHTWKGVQIGVGNAVDDLNAISSCVGDIKAGRGRLAPVDVSVVETRLIAWWDWNKTRPFQCHVTPWLAQP